MADKYAGKTAPSPAQEQAAEILQARLSWPEAERCAADLAAAGLPSTDRTQAIAILAGRMSHARAVACAKDLAMYGGLVPREVQP